MTANRSKRTAPIEYRMLLGAAIRDARIKLGWSSGTLATKVNVHRKLIQRIECGEISPSMGSLIGICKALDLPPFKLLEIAWRDVCAKGA